MATWGELLSGLVGGYRGVSGGAAADSAAKLKAELELANQRMAQRLGQQAAPGESVRGAVKQLADGSAYAVSPAPPSGPPLARQLGNRAVSSMQAELERSILESVTPTADADGRFTDNVFAGYNLLDRAAEDGSMYEVIDQLAAKYGIVNSGNERQYRQQIVNAIVNQQIVGRAETISRLTAEPNDLGGQLDDRGRVIGDSTLAGRLEGAPRATGVPGTSPRGLAETPLPKVVTGNGIADVGMPAPPLERLTVAEQPKPYITETVVQVDPTTGKPLLDSYGFEIPSTNSPSGGATSEPRLRSQTYNPTSAKRSAYRPILGRQRFYASAVDEAGAGTTDFSRELTVLQRGNGGDDTDRLYLIARPDGTYQAVDLANPDGGRLLSEAAVRDLLETQGYTAVTGPDIVGPRPGSTDPSFVEVSGRRLLETLNTEADVVNPQLLRQTLNSLNILETSGGGDRFAQAMVVAGKGDPDTAQVAMDLMRRQRKATAAAEIRQRLVSQTAGGEGQRSPMPSQVAGFLQQHPAFSGETPAEIEAYASMPEQELAAAAALNPAQSAIVDRFVGAFSEGYDLYKRAKSMVPESAPPQAGSFDANAGSTVGSGAMDVTQSVDPEAPPQGVDWGGVRTRLARYGSTPPTKVEPGAGPSMVVDAAAGGGAQVFDDPVPSEPMSSIMMDMAPEPASPDLSLLDRLRGMFGGSPASRMAGSGALAFETAPNSWASRIQEPILAAPQPFSIDVGSPASASASDVSGVSSPETAALESRRLSIALGVRARLTAATGGYSAEAVEMSLAKRPEFADVPYERIQQYAAMPDDQMRALADQATALSESFSNGAVAGPAADGVTPVAASPMSSRVAPLDEISRQARDAQTTLRGAAQGARQLDAQKQVADDFAYSIDMMRQYVDKAADPSTNINPWTGQQRTMAPQARILTFRPFTRLPKEMQAQILNASRGELDVMFEPAQKQYETLKAQSEQMAPQRREVRGGLDQAKDDAAFASDSMRAQNEATTVIDVNGMSTEIGPRTQNPRGEAEAAEAERAANRQFATSQGTASALGVRPAMSADARNAVVKEVLASNWAKQEGARSARSPVMPIVFRDFDTHEGGISESAVDDVRELQARVDAATDPAERAQLESELQTMVQRSFGDGMRERFNKKAGGINLLEPSGVNQNRLLRRFITAESPADRTAALREMFSERVSGNDLSDGLENLRKLAADGRLGSAEDIIYDALIRRLEFAQAQRGAVDQEGSLVEDSALDGSTPETLRQAASDAVRDMGLIESGPARILPKPAQEVAGPPKPMSPLRQAIQRVTDAMSQAGRVITGLDPNAPAAPEAPKDVDANEYLISTLPTREEIYAAKGSELDRISANINTARQNAADHASVAGTDMSRFQGELDTRVGHLARRMQQPDANYTPPVVEQGPLGFQEESILPKEAPPASRSATPTPPQFQPLKIRDATGLEIPGRHAGSIAVPAEQAALLRNWLAGSHDGSSPDAAAARSSAAVARMNELAEAPNKVRQDALRELAGDAEPTPEQEQQAAEMARAAAMASLPERVDLVLEMQGLNRATASKERLAHADKVARKLPSMPPEARDADFSHLQANQFGPKPKGPPRLEVQNGTDDEGAPSSTILVHQTYLVPQPDGTMKEVPITRKVTGRQLGIEDAGGGVTRLGQPAQGLAAIDFDETGMPLQVRSASTVPTRDLRGVDKEFEEVPIIGQGRKPAPETKETVSDDEFYNNAAVNRQGYEGEPFVEDTNLHEESVEAATAKPSGRTKGVAEGPTARSKEDLENLQRQVDRDVALKDKADKVRKAKTRRNIGLAAIASAGGAYGLLGGDEDATAVAGDFGLSGTPEEDTNQSSETVGDQVRRARQRRYTLMTPMNPVPW